MNYAVLRKGTLLIATEEGKDHLFAILNDPFGADRQVLLATFSSIRPHYFCEETCVIRGEKKEHSFMVVPTFVRYQLLRIELESKLLSGVDSKKMRPNFPLSEALFHRVRDGVFESRFAAEKYKVFLRTAIDAGC